MGEADNGPGRNGDAAVEVGHTADGSLFKDAESFTMEAAGQSLHFHPSGKGRWDALIDLVESARSSLELCFYIFAEDNSGRNFRDALVNAARRGVSVTLIIDRFGAEASDEFLQPLCDAGGTFLCFSPQKTQRYLIRNHQKIVIADKSRAIIGGFNIEDDYFATPRENGWNDLAITLQGSAVQGLCDWFGHLQDWTDDDEAHFRAIRREVREWSWEDGNARWLIGGPTNGLSTWARCVRDDLENGKRLDMFMAYFSPSKKVLKQIGRIASGGEARLLMAAKSDNNATLGAARSLYHYLLGKGARIWEFAPCKLHTKLIVLDDCVYIGSANFDMRSLYLNLEIMLKLTDKALAERMREYIDYHVVASELITPEKHERRATIWNRFRWNLGWLLVSVVDYTITRRLNLGL